LTQGGRKEKRKREGKRDRRDNYGCVVYRYLSEKRGNDTIHVKKAKLSMKL
jgi:hypothetical protein